MEFRKKITALSLALLFQSISFASNITPALIQDETNISAEEKAEAQNFARRFVKRMVETRDLAPLLNEFFLNGFISFFGRDYYEKVSPELYARLGDEEKVRLFIAQENLGYFMTLNMMSEPDSNNGSKNSSFERILPKRIAQKLDSSRLVEGVAEFTDHSELLKELIKLENAIVEARAILMKKNLEQTPEFQKSLAGFEKDSHGIGYRVRISVLEEDVKDKKGVLRLAAGQKLFRVETPIFYGITLGKEGGQFKILALEPADGD